ncbi:MAG: ExbD/TolR family protein [Alphaproteobacteria bacterium]
MVSVVFLLLAVFLFAGEFRSPEPFPVEVPRAELEAEARTAVATIVVAADGSLALDGATLAAPELITRLAAEDVTQAAIRADRGASARDVVALAARLRSAGIDTLDLVVSGP